MQILSPARLPLLLLAAAYAAPVIATFAYVARYSYPAQPLVVVLAGLAVAELVRRVLPRRRAAQPA